MSVHSLKLHVRDTNRKKKTDFKIANKESIAALLTQLFLGD